MGMTTTASGLQYEDTTVCRRLAEQRFLIRNCANFHGLDEQFIRIALKDEANNAAVADHLRAAVLAGPEV